MQKILLTCRILSFKIEIHDRAQISPKRLRVKSDLMTLFKARKLTVIDPE